MICKQLDCGAESLGFLASVRIATAKEAGTYSFGSYPEGDYQVDYLAGAYINTVFGYFALSGDPSTVEVLACDGLLAINTGLYPGSQTQVLAEEAVTCAHWCFHHSGGEISIRYSAANYGEMANGEMNPTFQLLELKPSTPAGGGGDKNTTSQTLVGGGAYGGAIQGCEIKIDCGDGASDNPISNFNSEAPEYPVNPRQPVLPSKPTDPFPDNPSDDPPPLPPDLNGVSFNCTSVTQSDGSVVNQCVDPGDGSGAFATEAECKAACSGGGPIPDPPPPNPPVPPGSWVCNGKGDCIDPGDGSGMDSYDVCVAVCNTSCAEITVSGPLIGPATLPLDCSCSADVTFSMPGGSFPAPVNGAQYVLAWNCGSNGWQLNYIDEHTLVMSALQVCGQAFEILFSSGPGTYQGCIRQSNAASGGCAVTFDVAGCNPCDDVKIYNVCQPSYVGHPQCNTSCSGCCTAINALGIGAVSPSWSNLALIECLGASPPSDFYIGSKKFTLSFVTSTPASASYKALVFYDVTRVA